VATVRIATFNLENFDEAAPDERPSLEERIGLMRPQIARLRADIACFQEVHGQERTGQPRALLALRSLLKGTNLDGAELVSTETSDGDVFDERNLVVATHHRITGHEQIRNKFVAQPLYKRLTANPPDAQAQPITLERPILHVQIEVDGGPLHIVTVHRSPRSPPTCPVRRLTISPGAAPTAGPRACSCPR
jgi:endonuclease/exonuclease/phosphatase family metal-dependent hydrolase